MGFSFSEPNIAQFNEKQRAAYELICAGGNVLVSGPAGTGKSTILNAVSLRYRGVLSVTASTGVAALNVKGSTIHSFAGLGRAIADAETIARDVLNRKRPKQNIERCVILVIEEISMISDAVFTKIDKVFRIVRRNNRPFGGVQLVLFGDFLQLPPVDRFDPENPGPPVGFAFESSSWREARIRTFLLTQVHRQADQDFANALCDVRMGIVDSPRLNKIFERNNVPLPTDGIRPVIIDTHNLSVDRINSFELQKICEKEFSYLAIERGEPRGLERLEKDCLAPKILRLKVGAQVMLLRNLDVANGLANGSLGQVVHLDKSTIKVKFTSGVPIVIERDKWEILSGKAVLAEREQFPLRLAYAITAHKVQGLTLDRIQCRLSKAFEFGQCYVALSRVKTLGGLYLSGFTRDKIMVHPRAVIFYKTGGEALDQDAHIEAMLEENQGFLKLAD